MERVLLRKANLLLIKKKHVAATGTRYGLFIRHSSVNSPLNTTKNSSDPKLVNKVKEIDPLKEYTIFGNIRTKKKDIWHYSDRKAGKGYSDYSSSLYANRPYIWPPLRKYFKLNFIIVGVGLFLLSWDYDWLLKKFNSFSSSLRPEASQLNNDAGTPSRSEAESETEEKPPEKPKKKKIGFRERRIIQYEDRLRMYSTPDKIFRYFATLKIENDDSGRNFEIFMTPQDFLRSFTPGTMQPRKWGLDSFKLYDPSKHKHNHKFSDRDSIFFKLGENGLISFSDYLFLMTLLSTSPNDFALAFKIFDVNGDGALDKDEFQQIQSLIMSQTSVGQKHRDHITPVTSFRVESNSALEAYFFGKDGKNKLSAEKFLEFQKMLYYDILKMEFNQRDALDGEDGRISEESFSQLLLMHAQIPSKRQKVMLKRVRKKFKGGPGITFAETSAFFQFLYQIEDVAMALHFHKMAGTPVDSTLLKRIGRKISGVDLTDHVVEVVITLFDDNQDGSLAHDEMIAAMRRRMRRGLERPRDTGVFRLASAVGSCAKRAAKANFDVFAYSN